MPSSRRATYMTPPALPACKFTKIRSNMPANGLENEAPAKFMSLDSASAIMPKQAAHRIPGLLEKYEKRHSPYSPKRCPEKRSTLQCPMQHTPLAIAPHSIPSARTTLLLHHRISPSGTPHPWLHQKPARYAEKASERNRKPPHSTRSSLFSNPKSPIPDYHKTHFPIQNSLFKFPIQCIS